MGESPPRGCGSGQMQMSRAAFQRSAFTRSTLRTYLFPFLESTHTRSSSFKACHISDYTSGRWLKNDREQRDSRSIRFNFDALCRRVIECCPGASSIIKFEKKEGGFSKAFLFLTDTGQRVVGRFPTRFSGPSGFTTNSEVTTIKYLQSRTSIPVPKIIDWSDNDQNPIGNEYILMEQCRGIQLNIIWSKLSVSEQIKIIQSTTRYMQQMTGLDFPAYGSLYFADAPILTGFARQNIDDMYCIGPHCNPRYWDCNVDDVRYRHICEPNRGPWNTLRAFCDGLIDTGCSRVPPDDFDHQHIRPFQGQPADHLELLKSAQSVLDNLISDNRISNNSSPTLSHSDLHSRNIFVDETNPTQITCIIDWQSTAIEPAFMYAHEIPDIATPDPVSSDTRPTLESMNQNLCYKAFDAGINSFVPRLSAVRGINDDLLGILRCVHQTWKDGIPALEEGLRTLSRRWDELRLPGTCPYVSPSGAKLAEYQERRKYYMSHINIKKGLIKLLETDEAGFVSNERYESVQAAHKAVFDEICRDIESGSEADVSVETLREIWPFDLVDDSIAQGEHYRNGDADTANVQDMAA